MRIRTDFATFADAVNAVYPISYGKGDWVIRLTPGDGTLTIAAESRHAAGAVSIDARIDGGEPLSVHGRLLRKALLGSAYGKPLEIVCRTNGAARRVVLIKDSEEHPLRELNPEAGCPMLGDSRTHYVFTPRRFTEIVERVLWAASDDPEAARLNGIFLEVESEQLRVVGCDGHRLAVYDSSSLLSAGLGAQTADTGVILQYQAAAAACHLARWWGEADVRMSFADGRCEIAGANWAVRSAMPFEYADYRRVIPDVARSVSMNLAALSDALIRTPEIWNDCALRLGARATLLPSTAMKHSKWEPLELEWAFPGLPLPMAFTARYLKDLASSFGAAGTRTRMFYDDPYGPALWTSPALPGYRAVCMPRRADA